MKNYLKQESFLGEAEDAEDAVHSTELLEQKLILLEKEIAELPQDSQALAIVSFPPRAGSTTSGSSNPVISLSQTSKYTT